MDGDPHDVINAYLEKVRREQEHDPGALEHLGERYGNRDIELEGIEFLDPDGDPRSAFAPGDPMVIRFRLDSKVRRDDVVVAYSLHKVGGGDLTGINTLTHHVDPLKVEEGASHVDYRVDSLPLWPGSYRITCIVHDLSSSTTFDCRQEEFGFSVMTGGLGNGEGLLYLPGNWDTDGLRG
jgi:hypothetical protein